MTGKTATKIDFESATPGDLSLLRDWMNGPHWRKWWGEPEKELADIRAMIEGEDTTRPYIVHINGRAFGYIQVWYVGPHQCPPWNQSDPWLMALPADAVGVDLSIGERTDLSKGLGTEVLAAFVSMLRAEGHENIFIDPDPRNLRAVRAYEKAGFRPADHLVERTPDVLVMQHVMANDRFLSENERTS